MAACNRGPRAGRGRRKVRPKTRLQPVHVRYIPTRRAVPLLLINLVSRLQPRRAPWLSVLRRSTWLVYLDAMRALNHSFHALLTSEKPFAPSLSATRFLYSASDGSSLCTSHQPKSIPHDTSNWVLIHSREKCRPSPGR